MSKETSQWLNQNTLIGFTDKRGTAWHYRAEDQGAETNHYAGAVPVADVLRRLFNWQAIEYPVLVDTPAGPVEQANRKAIVRNDTNAVLGIFKGGYQPHQYSEWLLDQVASILDDSLSIGSAGLLRGGAQAWVQVEVPENITTPEGVEFRPNLTACTSFDGSLATTYKRMITNVVCDNTMAAGMSEQGQSLKIKHSRYSQIKLASARDALALVYSAADDFAAEVAELCAQSVTEAQWQGVLNSLLPIPEDEGRGRTITLDKREKLDELYHFDLRVKPWTGSAYGVLQAFNTYEHHNKVVRGASRQERNMSDALSGKLFEAEGLALAALVG